MGNEEDRVSNPERVDAAKASEAESGARASESEAAFPASAKSETAPAAPVESESASVEGGKRSFFGRKIGSVATIAIALVLLVVLYFTMGAGSLNVTVLSSSGELDGQEVSVALYKGDVTRELIDDDPSNDPEPVQVHATTVSQRTTFNVEELGGYTVLVTFVDPDVPYGPYPIGASMFGADMRSTVEVH